VPWRVGSLFGRRGQAVMSGLGKVFAILNLLAAAGFIFLALMDLDARKQWAASALQHQMALDGLPLETPSADASASLIPFPYLFNRSVRIDEVEKSVVTSYLAESGGPEFGGADFVSSQSAEIARTLTKVKDSINSQPDSPGKLNRLRQILTNVAANSGERNGVTALLRDLQNESRRASARAELHLLGKAIRQQAALDSLVAIVDLDADPTNAAKIDAAKKSIVELVTVLGFGRGGSPEAGLETVVQELQANRLATKADLEAARAKLVELAQIGLSDADKSATSKVVEVIVQSAKAENPELPKLIEDAGLSLLEAKFADAAMPLAEGKALDVTKQQSTMTKRNRVAHLLYHLDSDRQPADRDAWQKRVLRVVGIQAYADVVEAQATRLSDMVQQMNAVISADQRAFLPQYSEAIQLCLFRAQKAEILVNQLVEQQQIEKNHKATVEQRQSELEELNKDLDRLKTEGKTKLTELSDTQKQLFSLTNRVRESQDELLNLEVDIKALEQKILQVNDKGR
jgi:hypothetical protein